MTAAYVASRAGATAASTLSTTIDDHRRPLTVLRKDQQMSGLPALLAGHNAPTLPKASRVAPFSGIIRVANIATQEAGVRVPNGEVQANCPSSAVAPAG